MPTHDIEADLPAHKIINTDVRVIVKSDGKTLGELLISKGTLDWRPAKYQKGVRLRWEQFAQLMEERMKR